MQMVTTKLNLCMNIHLSVYYTFFYQCCNLLNFCCTCCTYSFVLCLPYDRARQRRPHSVTPTMPPGRWRSDAVLPVRMPFRSYCMRRHCRASYPNTTSASSSAATSATSASRSNRAFTDHSTETQHTDSNTTLKHNTQTQKNQAFTDHSTETQHTDSKKTKPSPTIALKHNTQTQKNQAFTDHSTETQHTDSKKKPSLQRP